MRYDVLEVVHFVDGDTLWLRRQWVVAQMEEQELIGRDYLGGIKVRLHDGKKGLNTPEKGQDGWAKASQDLQWWFKQMAESNFPLRLDTYGKDGFGRTLGNVFFTTANGESDVVSFMISQGWKSYK